MSDFGHTTGAHPDCHGNKLSVILSIQPCLTILRSPSPAPPHKKKLQPTSTCTHHLTWGVSMFPIPLRNFPPHPPPKKKKIHLHTRHGPWIHYFFPPKFRQSSSASYNGNFLAWQVLRSSDKICRGLRQAFLVGQFFLGGNGCSGHFTTNPGNAFKETSSNLL